MVVIARTLFMKDLRSNFVFPRLVYAVIGQTIDRRIRAAARFLIRRPLNRVTEFVATWREHEKTAEILLAAFALTIALIRALALLVAAIGSLYLAFSQF